MTAISLDDPFLKKEGTIIDSLFSSLKSLLRREAKRDPLVAPVILDRPNLLNGFYPEQRFKFHEILALLNKDLGNLEGGQRLIATALGGQIIRGARTSEAAPGYSNLAVQYFATPALRPYLMPNEGKASRQQIVGEAIALACLSAEVPPDLCCFVLKRVLHENFGIEPNHPQPRAKPLALAATH